MTDAGDGCCRSLVGKRSDDTLLRDVVLYTASGVVASEKFVLFRRLDNSERRFGAVGPVLQEMLDAA